MTAVLLTEKDGAIHVDEGNHWNDPCGQCRMKQLTDSVVEHERGIQPYLSCLQKN